MECIEAGFDGRRHKVCHDLVTLSDKPFRPAFESLVEETRRVFDVALERKSDGGS
jgi:hypothetical protein